MISHKCCQTYQLEDILIHTEEIPAELVDYLCALADQCYFPPDQEKDQHVQFQFYHSLSDTALVKNVLLLDLTATTL